MGGLGPLDTIYTKLQYLIYPVQKGRTWMTPHLVYNPRDGKFQVPDSVAYSCADTSGLFETPVGRFVCVVYNHIETLEEVPGTLRDVYDYYAIGVGKVGTVTYNYIVSTQKRYPLSKSLLVGTNVIPVRQ